MGRLRFCFCGWQRSDGVKLTFGIGMYGTIVAIMLLTSGNGVTACS